MGELTNRVKTVRIEAERAVQIMLDAAEIIDNTNISGLHDALSETIKQRDELLVYNANQQSMLNKLDKELDVARDQAKQRDELRMQNAHLRTEVDRAGQLIYALKAQVQNLQEFNANQRKQLESLQKEMAAIHMCVVADSRTKLYDAMESYAGVFGEMPFLLKAVATGAEKSFDLKDAADRYASRISAARHQLES